MANWEKRAENREASKVMLAKKGIEYQEFNNGAHLKIGSIDFWPGTGLWKDGSLEDRGVENLIAYIKSRKEKKNNFSMSQGFCCPHCNKEIKIGK